MHKYVTKILMEANFEYQPHTKLQGYLYTSPPSLCGENVLKVSTIIWLPLYLTDHKEKLKHI